MIFTHIITGLKCFYVLYLDQFIDVYSDSSQINIFLILVIYIYIYIYIYIQIEGLRYTTCGNHDS